MINQINNKSYSPNQVKSASYNYDKNADDQKSQEDKTRVQSKTDRVDISQKSEMAVTYSNISAKKELSPSEIESLKSMAEQANHNLRSLVEQLILKQGKSFEKFQIKGYPSQNRVSADDIEAAKQAVSENGEFGVKAVSDRLVDFAKAISGGDKTKFEELKTAIERGFEEARKAFGGTLPEISHQTYNETMRKLEAWAKEE